MQEFPELYAAVQRNCDISDGQYAQNYGLCTYLLKMRELYRWEQQLPFSARLSNTDIGNWLAAREARWEALEEQEFDGLEFAGARYSVFDSDAINRHLLPRGLVYSGGYGRFAKPLFFIAELLEHRRYGDTEVFISGREHARELAAPPAMSQGRRVFIRRESVRRSLWEQLEEWQWRQQDNPHLNRLLAAYPLDSDLETGLEQMTEVQVETLLLHELGEVAVGELLGPEWEDLLYAVAGGKAELVLRAVRDHLADCRVTLPSLLQRDATNAVLLYAAGVKGMHKSLFPALLHAHRDWLAQDCSGTALHAVVERGQAHWWGIAQECLQRYREQPETVAEWLAQRSESMALEG